MLDDQVAWNSFLYGDESSFKAIFEAYYDQLFNYGRRFTSDETIIEDSLQDLFVKLWKNKEKISQTPSVKNYLYKAFRRTLMRKLDYAPKVMAFPAGEERISFEIEFGHDQTIINKERLREVQQRLQEALAKMTPREREIIHLKYYEELSYEEIAEIMQLSVKSAYKLLYRALHALKNNMPRIDLMFIIYLLSLKRD